MLEERGKVDNTIKELEEGIVCIGEEYMKIDVSEKIKKILDEFIDTTIKSKIEELEKTITELYHKLANKDDMVKEIKIDQKDLGTRLIGFDGEIIDKESISAGEKEIYALSILWGLSKISNKKFPLVVDSLLARLDNTHTDNIVKNFFPNSGEQVIVLGNNKEISKKVYCDLMPHINKEYKLSFDENNKLIDYYFKESVCQAN